MQVQVQVQQGQEACYLAEELISAAGVGWRGRDSGRSDVDGIASRSG